MPTVRRFPILIICGHSIKRCLVDKLNDEINNCAGLPLNLFDSMEAAFC